tara:strand:+ start:1289 stop:1639 length:351 start_codon:yes stop_codon:yes gene_type:complete
MKKCLLGAAIFLLTGCASKRMHGIDMKNLTGTPCIDGVIYNVQQAGCEVFYWGHTRSDALKLRCTYSDHENFYTQTSFYAVPLGFELDVRLPQGHIALPYCADTQSLVYAAIPYTE